MRQFRPLVTGRKWHNLSADLFLFYLFWYFIFYSTRGTASDPQKYINDKLWGRALHETRFAIVYEGPSASSSSTVRQGSDWTCKSPARPKTRRDNHAESVRCSPSAISVLTRCFTPPRLLFFKPKKVHVSMTSGFRHSNLKR